jgi:Ca-activated chloride channel homolog
VNLDLARPLVLLLLLAVPLYPLLSRRFAVAVPLPRTGHLQAARGATPLIAALPTLFRCVLLSALVIAIAGPSTAGAVIEERSEGIPIVLAIDISSSMLARDFQPRDRITVAKATIGEFVAGRENDPVGLVALAGEALTLVPPTTRRPLLESAIESLQVGLLQDGTAIGDGLAAAINRLRDYEGEGGVIVLLSDGESNRGTIDPLAASEAAATLGIQVHTVGVGSEGVAEVPVGAAPAGFRYAEQPVGLDEELLRGIAERTGGNYYRATDPETLQRIYAEIDRLVPSVVETTTRVERTDWAAALILLAAVLFLSEWGIRGSAWGPVP